MIWNIDFDVAAMLLTLVVLAIYFSRGSFPNWSNRLFLAYALMSLVASASDIITVYTNAEMPNVPLWADYMLNIIYYLSFNSLPILLYIYTVNWTMESKISKWSRVVTRTVFLIEWILILTTPLTQLVFSFEDGVYTHGVLRDMFYLLAGLMIGLTVYQVIYYRVKLRRTQFLLELLFAGIVIGLVIYQYFYIQILLLNFVAALFLVLIYMNLQDKGVYLNKVTECFNRKAFIEYIGAKMIKKESGAILTLRFDGQAYINRIIGVAASKARSKEIGSILCTEFKKINVYNIADSEFYIIFEDIKTARSKVDWLEGALSKKTVGTDIGVDWEPLLCIIEFPKVCSSTDDLDAIVSYGYEQLKYRSDLRLVIADTTFLDGKRRKREVVQAINKAIAVGGFEVVFQPIYNRHTQAFSSAEVLVRLTDENLGRISPMEFVPIAEETGTIGQIDSFVFHKVCEFLEEKKIRQYGVEYVEVNLSVTEFMEDRLWNRLSKEMMAHNIAPSEINFEVTETAYMDMESQFEANVKELLYNGASISMDDYGTGFSNISYLLKYPYKLVKIDQMMLWRAMKEERAMTILEDTVTMLKELGCDIVVEGVETLEQVALMERLQVDELQGYYYSKPISMDEYVLFLQRHNGEGVQVEL